jgi:hypothetical protein
MLLYRSSRLFDIVARQGQATVRHLYRADVPWSTRPPGLRCLDVADDLQQSSGSGFPIAVMPVKPGSPSPTVYVPSSLAAGQMLVPASLGAVAAFITVALVALVLRRRLASIPENMLKFVVGVLLTQLRCVMDRRRRRTSLRIRTPHPQQAIHATAPHGVSSTSLRSDRRAKAWAVSLPACTPRGMLAQGDLLKCQVSVTAAEEGEEP